MLMTESVDWRPLSPPVLQHRHRRDWVRVNVNCLMCGRLLGHLLGTTRSGANGNRTAGQPIAYVAYRSLDPDGHVVRFTPALRFRCSTCGGAGALDELDVFSTYDEKTADGSS